jgi:hypothetical protein
MDRPTALSGKTKGWIKVKIDRGQHVRPQIVNARVVERHGRGEDGTYRTVVVIDGREVEVTHTLIRGLWKPV